MNGATMQQPNILFYGLFGLDREHMVKPDGTERKVPVYVLERYYGNYTPMWQMAMKGGENRGRVAFYLMQRRDNQTDNAPRMSLQGVGSFNFTGLKGLIAWDGTAYGYPNSMPTYGRDNKPNPFYTRRDDGYLFQFRQDDRELLCNGYTIPSHFELLILENAKQLVSAYCQQLQMGHERKSLARCRAAAVKWGVGGDDAKS